MPILQLNRGDICRVVPNGNAPVPAELIGVHVQLSRCFQSERDKDYFWSVALPADPNTELQYEGREVWLHETILHKVRDAAPEKKRKRRRIVQ